MLLAVCSCSRGGMNGSEEFADSLLLPATPARCTSDGEMMWLHVMIETVEADRLGMGDSIALSPLWTVRNLLDERSRQCYATGADVTTDGTLADAWYAFCRYGSATYTSYCTRPFDQPTPDAAYTTAARAAQHAATTASHPEKQRKEYPLHSTRHSVHRLSTPISTVWNTPRTNCQKAWRCLTNGRHTPHSPINLITLIYSQICTAVTNVTQHTICRLIRSFHSSATRSVKGIPWHGKATCMPESQTTTLQTWQT